MWGFCCHFLLKEDFEIGFVGRKLEQSRGTEPGGKPALGKEKRETLRAESASCITDVFLHPARRGAGKGDPTSFQPWRGVE